MKASPASTLWLDEIGANRCCARSGAFVAMWTRPPAPRSRLGRPCTRASWRLAAGCFAARDCAPRVNGKMRWKSLGAVRFKDGLAAAVAAAIAAHDGAGDTPD